ncbi:hypothetical protein ABW20_dc0105559 [Dactylellina cionopaga]|nr:hypothetical protein ABW20_dc0105559 [Dactylellina cionopaga]
MAHRLRRPLLPYLFTPPTRLRPILLKLKTDVLKAKAEAGRRATAGIFKNACATDLLFLIDTTSSMHRHIKAAKDQVKSIVRDIEDTFFNEAEVRIAVVGYKDYGDSPNIQFLDFTSESDDVRSFIDALRATGGGDTPEDVLGGIRQAINASWRHPTRCIIHIADAPPHGRIHHDLGGHEDSNIDAGHEYGALIKQMIGLSINYALLRINELTDRMALNFLKIYADASAECKLHVANIYHAEGARYNSYSRTKGSTGRSTVAGLVFEESQLGVKFSDLHHLVVKMVTTSVSRTAVRGFAPGKVKQFKNQGFGLGAIHEDGDDDDDVPLENIPPQWDKRGWLNETLVVEGFSPDVIVHGPTTLDSMMANDENIKMSVTEFTIYKRSRPFAQGAARLAFYARTMSSEDRFVVKAFKKGGKGLPHLAEDMRGQALCKAFALEFNAFSGAASYPIDFIVTTCLKGKQGVASEEECLSLEPFIQGEYIKYNNNCGYVNTEIPNDKFNQAAQAFSHFTFERSQGRFMVSDLQGVGNLLTDPAIHTKDPERFKLADTNLGDAGFKFFFSSHKCNHICTKLGLKSKASMVKKGSYSFKKNWPSLANTVCCSNKLCGKIVGLASAKRTPEFPGFHWCDKCWPQLQSSKVKRICLAPGPHHEFDVSMFFYESQGQRTVRTCPTHTEGGMVAAVTEEMITRLNNINLSKEHHTASPPMPRADGFQVPIARSGTFPERQAHRFSVPRAAETVTRSRTVITYEPDTRGFYNPTASSALRPAPPVVVDSGGNFWNKLKHATNKTFVPGRSSRSVLTKKPYV